MRAPRRPEPMELLEQLWAVDQALGVLSRRMLRAVGVTGQQRVALRVIAQDPAVTAARLAARLKVDRSSIAGVLDRLEAAGLLRRQPDARDGRKHRLELTDAGRAVDALDHGTIEAAMARTLAERSDDEVRIIEAFLARFSEEIEREGSVLPPEGA